MVWDLGHIGNFEDLWLCQELAGLPAIEKTYERMFDAGLNPRPTRADLPLPVGNELFGYMDSVRERALRCLDPSRDGRRRDLLAGGMVYELVAEHEEQHQETLLQAMQSLEQPAYVAAQRRRLPRPSRAVLEMMRPEAMRIPAGPFLMGAGEAGFAYDNERGRHEVDLGEFWIDRFPVSQGEYLQFIEAGGYVKREHWSPEGWAWREETGAEAPLNWRRGGRDGGGRDGEWSVRFMNREGPVPVELPVIHVSYWEAEAYAAYAGKRLPTEAEWEKAALWDPESGAARRYPWGHVEPGSHRSHANHTIYTRANLDQLAFQPAPIGAYPAGASAYGVEQMVGDVWEWTSSDFTAYPGFEAFPYEEYSAIFFGSDYKVLRGGSWATRPAVARGAFRNWDYPIRRQIFSGFRCVRDGGDPAANS